MTRPSMTLATWALGSGLIAVSLTGCLDRGGLGSNDAGGDPMDAGSATGGKTASQTGGAGMPGTGGTSGSGGTGATPGGETGGAPAGTGGESPNGGTTGSGAVTGTGGRVGSAGAGGTGAARGTGGVTGMGGTGGKEMCGPVCAIYCQYGNVLDARGCPTCACKQKPDCVPRGGACATACPNGYAADPTTGCATCACKGTICPTIACPACPNGYVTDPKTGCSTCMCNPKPVCPSIACLVACPNGYAADPNTGCGTCTCLPDPNACSATDCGPQPPEPVTLLCPGTGVPSGGPAPPMGATAPIAPPPPGPYTCEQTSAGKCLWHKGTCVVCPAVTCKIYCANGFNTGVDGCPTCACNPAPTPVTDCAGYVDRSSCVVDSQCTWLQPGCTEPALAAAGCYAKSDVGCTSDANCGQGHQCLKRVVNPCSGNGTGFAACTACGLVQTICQ